MVPAVQWPAIDTYLWSGATALLLASGVAMTWGTQVLAVFVDVESTAR
jgi:hypothetical protein